MRGAASAFAGLDLGLDGAEGAAENERLAAIVRGKIAVAGAHGQAIRLADDGADDQFEIEVEVADHATQDGDLSGILLAEEGFVRGDDVEQLGYDGGDAAKVAGAGGAVEAILDFFDLNEGGGAVGIHLGGIRREEQIDVLGFEEAAVGLEGAGVFREVLVGGELGGVDEDGGGNRIAGGFRGADEREVPVVQRAHGGNQAQ